jgi:hypothetical protein
VDITDNVGCGNYSLVTNYLYSKLYHAACWVGDRSFCGFAWFSISKKAATADRAENSQSLSAFGGRARPRRITNYQKAHGRSARTCVGKGGTENGSPKLKTNSRISLGLEGTLQNIYSKYDLWIRPPALIVRLSWVDTRVVDFSMILFYLC